ncbi:UPF0160 protein MYG1, mitochondrial [Hondaea fermentalgiana]|uniref:UPF0160 protein MYG1, mitochondrial n=1 Tax=Hondaea fermentalgiana TaxID=2315210 RepID=A0A2R5GDD7_9STRA|nr:UPF0160 protein MYG1, mitochondrial [Hondaea fermentalgiana]|eukprot:GBG28575.1 UPF0160 protein MYG1, mitochondrial [Hondaea fermentalgiana]
MSVKETAMKLVDAVEVSAPAKDAASFSDCVGTHNGHFHCDEAFACGMLQMVSQFRGLPIVRTRDSTVLDQCKIVVDVGGTFDADALRFDHHQREFQDVFFSEDFKTKLSSAGLVYKYFGKEIIRFIAEESKTTVSDEVLEVLYKRVYKNFVEHIDGIDNGIDAYTGEKNYSVSTHLSARVGSLNPAWNAPPVADETAREMGQFKEAMRLTLSEFVDTVEGLLKIWLPAREIVERAIKSRKEIDPSGAIIRFEESCPWRSHLFALETEGVDGLAEGDLKYVLYPDSNGAWRIQCVPVEESSFTNRKSLPEKYRGIRDDALSEAWGIPGCIFVHNSGFIGGNRTYEGVLEMARQSLNQS